MKSPIFKATNELFDIKKHDFSKPTVSRGNYGGSDFLERVVMLGDGIGVLIQMRQSAGHEVNDRFITFLANDSSNHEICYVGIGDGFGDGRYIMDNNGHGETPINKEQFFDLVNSFSWCAMEWLIWNTI